MSDKRESVLAKVRKILDRAEGTNHQGEIDAALALAQRLMAEHAIEMADVDKLRDGDKPEQIIKRRVAVGANKSPSSTSKGQLAVSVSENNRCKVYRELASWEYTLVFVGYESDVDFVEMLWTSLCVQMDAAHDIAKRSKREWVNGRTFRKNFMDGFVSEAHDRLRSMRKENERVIEEAAIEAGSSGGTSLVLRSREKDVEDFLNQNVGKLRRSYSGRSSYDGHATQAGRTAATKADYSGGRTARIGSRGQIGSGG